MVPWVFCIFICLNQLMYFLEAFFETSDHHQAVHGRPCKSQLHCQWLQENSGLFNNQALVVRPVSDKSKPVVY